jgi:hypothetical protein
MPSQKYDPDVDGDQIIPMAQRDNRYMNSPFAKWNVAVASALLCACTSLLPRGSTDTTTVFSSFSEAQAALEHIVALQTPTSELKAMGFDILSGANVTLISYPEIVARLTPNPGVPLDKIDQGIRQCIEVQTRCRGHLFHFERQERKREGNFWLDFFNMRRTTNVRGWWFEALIVVTDDKVLFRNYAGQAHADRVDRQVNPLGPFQPSGEGAGAALLRGW